MENASKALIIAGEVFIALIVLGLWVTLVFLMGGFSANINDRVASDKVAEFNRHFTDFEGRIDISAEEIATIINFAKSNNDEKDLSINDAGTREQSVYWVDVEIDGLNAFKDNRIIGQSNYSSMSKFKSQLNKFIKNNNDKYFYCNVDVSNNNTKPRVDGTSNLYNPTTNKKGKIKINLANTDIEYSLNRKDQTKLVTKIKFGVLDYGTATREGTIKYPSNTEEELKFTLKNDGRNMYTYEYNN